MKTFTIEFPSKKVDAAGVYKNYLLNRLNDSYPELSIDGIDGPETYNSYQYIGPKENVGFGLSPTYHVSRYNPCNSCAGCPFACPFKFNTPKSYNLATDFQRAMKKLDDYAKYVRACREVDDIDYTYFGIPVKEHQSYIQVGNTIIPKRKNGGYYLGNLTKEQKTTITNIIVNINNITNVYE